MTFLDKLEKRFGHWAVPNVVLYIIIAQLVVYALVIGGVVSMEGLVLYPRAILAGQIWRLFTCFLTPPYLVGDPLGAIFLAFYWFILWMTSSALEQRWGLVRFNSFLALGAICTIVGAFLGQFISASPVVVLPVYLFSSIFFAFAVTHPDVEFMVMMVLPVKVKWLALFGALALVYFLFFKLDSWGMRVATLGPLFNFFLFFRKDLSNSVESRQRRKAFAKERIERDNAAFHTCAECGATDKTNPERHFRYKTVDGEAVCICDVCKEGE